MSVGSRFCFTRHQTLYWLVASQVTSHSPTTVRHKTFILCDQFQGHPRSPLNHDLFMCILHRRTKIPMIINWLYKNTWSELTMLFRSIEMGSCYCNNKYCKQNAFIFNWVVQTSRTSQWIVMILWLKGHATWRIRVRYCRKVNLWVRQRWIWWALESINLCDDVW